MESERGMELQAWIYWTSHFAVLLATLFSSFVWIKATSNGFDLGGNPLFSNVGMFSFLISGYLLSGMLFAKYKRHAGWYKRLKPALLVVVVVGIASLVANVSM